MALLQGAADAADCGGARPCRCGDRVVEDYVLPDDLGPCAEHGLRIRRRIVFDGNGHRIRGSGTRGSHGLQVDSKGSGTQVRDLEVSGFERGVRLVKVEQVRLSRVRSHGNGDFEARVGYGIDLADGASRNVLEDVRVYGNADEGIHVGSGAHENRIVDSEVYDNTRENVYFLRNHGNLLARSRLHGAGSASVYVKHAARTALEDNQIAGAPIQVRGASRDTRVAGNVLRDAAVVLQGYDDQQTGLAHPSGTVIRGGRIQAGAVCLRLEGATGTIVEDVVLSCPREVALSKGATATAVGVEVAAARVQCAGPGVLARARRVEVRFRDAGGAPLARVEVRAAGDDALLGVASDDGVFAGLVVESRIVCPGGKTEDGGRVVLSAGGRKRELPIAELRGEVRF